MHGVRKEFLVYSLGFRVYGLLFIVYGLLFMVERFFMICCGDIVCTHYMVVIQKS